MNLIGLTVTGLLLGAGLGACAHGRGWYVFLAVLGNVVWMSVFVVPPCGLVVMMPVYGFALALWVATRTMEESETLPDLLVAQFACGGCGLLYGGFAGAAVALAVESVSPIPVVGGSTQLGPALAAMFGGLFGGAGGFIAGTLGGSLGRPAGWGVGGAFGAPAPLVWASTWPDEFQALVAAAAVAGGGFGVLVGYRVQRAGEARTWQKPYQSPDLPLVRPLARRLHHSPLRTWPGE